MAQDGGVFPALIYSFHIHHTAKLCQNRVTTCPLWSARCQVWGYFHVQSDVKYTDAVRDINEEVRTVNDQENFNRTKLG